jgi:hypothetical protein
LSTPSTDTPIAPPNTGQDTKEVTRVKRKPVPPKGRKFDSESGSKAVSARWAKQRAAESAPNDEGDVDRAKVIGALRKKAYEGDVPAARELREWLARFDPDKQTSASMLALLTADQRAIFEAWIRETG